MTERNTPGRTPHITGRGILPGISRGQKLLLSNRDTGSTKTGDGTTEKDTGMNGAVMAMIGNGTTATVMITAGGTDSIDYVDCMGQGARGDTAP